MSVLAKPVKTKRKPESASATLDQLESYGDRVGNWIAENAVWITSAAAVILLAAGGYGFANSRQQAASQEASGALAAVESNYLRAMGGTADTVVVEEPANAATARRVREEYVGLYQEVAGNFSGTLEGVLASLEVGSLQHALGNADEAIATWQNALDGASGHPPGKALLLERIAGAHESAGRWEDAGTAHEAASQIETFPIRHMATLDAARCFAEAGDTTRALALFSKLEADAPQYRLSPAMQSRLNELRASQ